MQEGLKVYEVSSSMQRSMSHGMKRQIMLRRNVLIMRRPCSKRRVRYYDLTVPHLDLLCAQVIVEFDGSAENLPATEQAHLIEVRQIHCSVLSQRECLFRGWHV